MLRIDRAWSLLSLACTLEGACEGGSDVDEGADELELWPIPNAGDPAPSIGRARDAGMDAASTRDAGSVARDASFDANQAADAKEAEPSGPPDLSLQVFDPKQVYLWGTLSEGACYRDGVASVFDPDRVAVGFTCEAGGGQIRPSDGRLLYLASTFGSGVRVFSCDGCQADAGVANYPLMPEANDELIPSVCGADAGPLYEWGFLTLPDGGVVQLCGTRWVDSQGNTLAAAKPRILAFGHANTALLADGVLDLADAAVQPLVGLDAGGQFPRAYRVREDGYWVVPPPQDGGASELWQVAFDGSAGRVGVYPPLPAGQRLRYEAKLDGDGDLFEHASSMTFHDTIVRRSLDGGSHVIYDEATGPRLKIHISTLVTGP